MKAIIEFSNITKTFPSKRDGARSLKYYLSRLLRKSKGDRSTPQESKTVLDDVSFKVREGEFVGIMGRNGVGKSTILKILAGIYKPTSGHARIEGRIAPVLELGAGFAEELSGKENILLNASILGYGQKQVLANLDKIIEFSELGENIYEPVRNYSSGMLVRLAFSIACHLDCDLLLFDEVLAVGDIGFQEKCINKIMELHTQKKSIVLVSHNPEQIARYCSRCLLIDHGKLIYDGPATMGADEYRKLFA